MAAAALLLVAGCGEEEDPQQLNECDAIGPLEFEGEAASPGDECGDSVCGQLVCDEDDGTNLICDDPGLNACDGCAELEHDVGDDCFTDEGDEGQWVCDGEDDLECLYEDVNACGGSGTLDNEPGDTCGSCNLDNYECAGFDEVACSNEIGCPSASNVSATQGTHSDHVRVTWQGTPYAQGFRIYRDGDEIGEVSGGTLFFEDDDVEPGGAPEEIDVSASTDRIDGITVEWESETAEGTHYEYEVEVLYPEGTSSPNAGPATGFAGADVDNYELSRDGDDWNDVGTDTFYFDDEASKAGVDDVTPVVTGTGWDFVELSATPTITDPDEHTYEVRAVVDGETSDPGEATGQRTFGEETLAWTASYDEETIELTDCAGQNTCIDDDYPADLDVDGRQYELTVDGDGIEETTGSIWGGVDDLVVALDPVEESYEIGETAEFVAQVESEDGEAVHRPGVELSVSPSVEVTNDPPAAVTTDADGQATASLTFDQAAQDVTIDFTSDADARVADDTWTTNSFTIGPPPGTAIDSEMTYYETSHELLANGQDYTQIDIELTDGTTPLVNVGVDVSTDPGASLDCDATTDSEGLATCEIWADEPGSYDVSLEEPTTDTLEGVGPFYATADDYIALDGQLNDAVIFNDFAIFGGTDLTGADEPLPDEPQSTVLFDRAEGEVFMELAPEIDEVDALAADEDAGEIYVLGDDTLQKFTAESEESMTIIDADVSGDLLTLEGDFAVVADSNSLAVEQLDREDLSTVESDTGFLDSGEYLAMRSAADFAYVLGDSLAGGLGGDEYLFASFDLGDELETSFYLDADDVDGSVDYFDVGTGTDHFVSGDFTEIDGEDRAGIARLDDDGNADTDFAIGETDAPTTVGGLMYNDGVLWSVGLFDNAGGQAFDANTGDHLPEYGLDNTFAWAEIATASRQLLLFESADEGEEAPLFELVDRPDVEKTILMDD